MLFVHVGTHKTGTSALQAFLARRKEKLESKGIRYLESGRAAGKAHHELAWAIREVKGANPAAWTEANIELRSNAAPIKIISSEGFWFSDPAEVKAQLADDTNIRVVMYLRRQDKYLQSLYKQTVAGGRKISFSEWLERFHFRGDYLSVVQKWADQFGKDSLIIRPYERDGRTIDVVADFMQLLGTEAETVTTAKKRGKHNPSPRRELMELIRAFNQLSIDVDRNKFFHSIIARSNSYIRTADILNYDECAALIQEFALGNQILIRDYYRDSPPLFPELTQFDSPLIWEPGSREYFEMVVDVLEAVWNTAISQHRDGARNGKPETSAEHPSVDA